MTGAYLKEASWYVYHRQDQGKVSPPLASVVMLWALHPDHLYQAAAPPYPSPTAGSFGCEWPTAATSLENHPWLMGVA